MAASIEPTSSREIECRKICVERFIFAIVYSVAMQYVLLTVFLLLVNFSLLAPIQWIVGSFRLLFSLSTWLWAMPLVSAVIIHGVFLAKSFLAGSQYCPTRFQQIYRSVIQKSVLLVVNVVVGFLTAWLYTRFLRDDYRVLFLPAEQNGNSTFLLNEKYLFLLLGGTFAGVYYFIKMKHEQATSLNFPVIQQPRYQQIRAHLYSILYQSLFKSFAPALIYASFYYTFCCVYFRYKLAAFTGVSLAQASSLASFYAILTDIRLLLYCWILFSQILSSMNLMQILFHICLTEYRAFPLEKSTLALDNQVSLVEALASSRIPIIQQLAALDLFTISEESDPSRRTRLYALSIPGGHPYNWRLLSEECIRLLRDFSSELSRSIEGVPAKSPHPTAAKLRPTASMDAEKVLMKQYNESYGIRSLSSPTLPTESITQQPEPICKAVDRRLDSL